MESPSAAKRPSVLTIDRAAFLLLRVKRAFKKKRQQRKDKHAAAAAAAAEALGSCRRVHPPLLRSRTLPAIVVPGLSILHAQIDPANNDLAQSQMLSRGVSSHKVCGLRAQTPRISFTGKDEDPHEFRRKSASSRLGSSPRASIASEERTDGLILRVPTPRGSVSSTGSSRLARLLTQGVRGAPEELNMDAPRRLSWERRESFGQLPRSASIDSMVEAAICARHSEPSAPTLAPPGRADRALSLVSPAVGRRAKTQRGQAADSKPESPSVQADDIHIDDNEIDNLENIIQSEVMEEPEPMDLPNSADTIDDSILEILGEAPAPEKVGQTLHSQIADRWLDVLRNGLKKEEKERICKDNPTFTNCILMNPPKINPEVNAALAETAEQRSVD